MDEGTFPCQDSLPWAGLAAAEDAETYTASHLTELAAGERSFAAALQTCDRDRRMRRGDSHPEVSVARCAAQIGEWLLFHGEFHVLEPWLRFVFDQRRGVGNSSRVIVALVENANLTRATVPQADNLALDPAVLRHARAQLVVRS